MNTTHLTTAAVIALLLLAFGLVGQSDYEAAVAADQHYTEMVCAGHWPDFDSRRPDCGAIQNANYRKCPFCKQYSDPADMKHNPSSRYYYHAACKTEYRNSRSDTK
jgi:hypothetical protein